MNLRHLPRPFQAVGAVVLATTILLGCGGSSEDAASKESDTPLQDLFGTSDEMKERQRKVEEKVSQCMIDKGWKYVPLDVDRMFGNSGEGSIFEDDKAFREKYGYGISMQPSESDFGGGGEFVDPNQEYVTSLTEAEQQQYYKDLEGESFGPAGDGVTEATIAADVGSIGDGERTGCRADAERATEGNLFEDPKFFEALDSLSQNFENDPRVIESGEKWSACMKEAGYEFEKPDDVYESFSSRMAELQGFESGGESPIATIETVPAPTDDAPIPIEGDGGIGGPPIGEPDPVKLKALQTEELATAKADGVCTDKHLTKVRSELEQELYDQLVTQFPELAKK